MSSVATSASAVPARTTEVVELTYRPVASVRMSSDPSRLRRTITAIHGLVMVAVGDQGLAPAGPLFTRFHRRGIEIELEAGIPLAQSIQPVGVVAASSLPGGMALRLLHDGDHATLANSYEALEAFRTCHGYQAAGGPWECYLVDASDTPDPAEWRTDIYLPLWS
jgi:effector-binding domain-containing protein